MSPSYPLFPVSPAESAAPLPYELYIQLETLAASWPREGSGWAGAVAACCGLQAAELTLRLIEDARDDTRPAASTQQRLARFAGHLIDGLELTCRLLRDTAVPDQVRTGSADRVRTGSADPAPSPGFALLSRLHRDQVDLVTKRFALASSGLPFRVGIEEQLAAARRDHGLPELAVAAPEAVLDYATAVSPRTVFALREPSPYGPEDHLFATAHQITECWLRTAHHYLDEAGARACQRRWTAAAGALRDASDCLALASEAGQLLDLMVLADYHPLRVGLRDGSGAQSKAAQQLRPAARAAARPLWTALEAERLSALDLLDQPAAHVGQYQYLIGLKTVGKRIQSFLFAHYLLALGVLGTHSLGSAGYQIRTLAERAAQPVFPEINQLHHDYVMITNFRYGARSGAIVLRNEVAHGWNPYEAIDRPAECPRETIEARVAEYFQFIEERNAEKWVKLFDSVRGQLQDVPGTRPYLGHAHLRVFINGMFHAFAELRGTHSDPRIDGNTASVDWHFDAVSYHGQRVSFDGREDFVFAADGRILRAVADWSPAQVARVWRDRLAAPPPGRHLRRRPTGA